MVNPLDFLLSSCVSIVPTTTYIIYCSIDRDYDIANYKKIYNTRDIEKTKNTRIWQHCL